MALKLADSKPIARATMAAFIEAPKLVQEHSALPPGPMKLGREAEQAGPAPTHLMEVQQKKGEHQDSFLHLAKPSSGSTEYKAGSHNCDEDDTTPCTVSC